MNSVKRFKFLETKHFLFHRVPINSFIKCTDLLFFIDISSLKVLSEHIKTLIFI